MKKHHQIIVIGPIASGKSTASRYLADSFDLPMIDADLFEENPFLPLYVEDTARWSFATELFFTIQRIKKLKTIRRLLKKDSVIVDAGLIMSYQVYTKNHLVQGTMTAAEWEFFSAIVDDYQKEVPKPSIVIALAASPKTQMKRIKNRGRSFEKGYTIEYLRQITDRLEEYVEQLRDEKDSKVIEFSTEDFDLVTEKGKNKLLKILKKEIG